MDLTYLIREVRPVKTLTFTEAALEVALGRDEPLLVHGNADSIEAFRLTAGRLAYGSAVVLCDLSAEQLDDAEKTAAASDFKAWLRGPDFPGLPDGARTWVKALPDNDHYGTHLPVLLEAVKRTAGPVLELGCGRSSTPALHSLCASQGRLLVTLDRDAEWLRGFMRCATDLHRLEHVADPAASPWLDHEWGVVFVDHAPGETRGHAIERARDRAEYVVVHDTETLGYGLEPLLSTFTHRKDFRRARPWTSVASMTKEIW